MEKKKKYVSPDIAEYDVTMRTVLCTSNEGLQENPNGEFDY